MAETAQALINFFVNTSSASKKIEDFKKRVSETKKSLADNAFGKLFPALGAAGGFTALKEVYQTTRKLADFSERFSLPVEQVGQFSNVLSLFGGSTDDAVRGLGSLEQAITELRTTGGGALRTVASQVGLSLYNMDGSIKDSFALLGDLRERFKGMNKDARLKVAQELNLDDPATLRYLTATDEEFARINAEAAKMPTVSAETAKNVQHLNRLLATMKANWYGVGVTLLGLVLKPVQKLADMLGWLNRQSEMTQKIILGIGGAFTFLPIVLSGLSFMWGQLQLIYSVVKLLVSLPFGVIVQTVSSLWGMLPKVLGTLKAAGAFFAANPILLGITAIAAAAYLLYTNWDKITDAVDRFLAKQPEIKKFFDSLNLVLTPFKMLGDMVGDALFKPKDPSEIKTIEQMTDEEYAKENGVSVERAKQIRAARKSFMETGEVLPTSGQIQAEKGIENTVNNNNARTDNSKQVVVNNNVTINGAQNTREAERSAARIIQQGTNGVRNG